MKEDKYLDDLFEQAKNEPPQLSFEEVATRFESTVATTGSLAVLKEWVLNHLNLNSFLMITVASSILTILYLTITPVNPISDIEKNITENTAVEMSANQDIALETTYVSKEGTATEKVAPPQKLTPPQVTPTLKMEGTTLEPISTKVQKINPLAKKSKQITVNEIQNLPATNIGQQQQVLTDSNQLFQDQLVRGTNHVELSKNQSAASTSSNSNAENTVTSDPGKRKRKKKRWGEGRGRGKGKGKGIGKGVGTAETVWKEYNKSFQKEYDISATGTTQIISEFGKINIQPWNKNKVKVVVTATVSAHKVKITERVLENIDIEFTKKGDKVKVETKVSNKKAIRWHNRKNWKASIDYEVFIPQSSAIDIKHTNGDVTIGALQGKTNLDLRLGDLSAEHIGKEASVKLFNGKGFIKNGEDIFSDLQFAELSAEKLGAVDLAINNSTFEAAETADISGNSYLGKLKFGTINNYNLKGTGGDITIQKAQKVNLIHNNLNIYIGRAKDISAELEHSKFRAKELGNVNLAIKNSNFEVQKATLIKGNSTWGTINLGTVDSYENTSHGTKVQIEKVNTVKTKGHSTKLTIGEVVNDIAIDFEFGNCTANINSLNPQVNLTGKNADFDLTIPQQAQFQFDMMSNTKNYSFPKDIQLKRKIEKVTHHEAEGFSKDSTVQNLLKVDLLWGRFELEKNTQEH